MFYFNNFKILLFLIYGDQTDYLHICFIGFNHRKIQNGTEFANSHTIDKFLIFVDLLKTFEMLGWCFMLNTVKHYRFNNSLLRWVHTLHIDKDIL